MTNGGYGLGHSVSDIKKYSLGKKVLDALELSFEEDQIQTSLEEIDKWLNKIEGLFSGINRFRSS